MGRNLRGKQHILSPRLNNRVIPYFKFRPEFYFGNVLNFLFFFCRKSIFLLLAPGWAPILGSRFQRVEHGQTSKKLVVKVGNGTKKLKLEKVPLDKF